MPRAHTGLVTLLLPLAAACAGGPAAEAGSPAPPGMAIGSPTPTSVAAGVYEAAQATRGSAAYAEACSACHAADLRGDSNAPSLVGVSFLFVWENRSLDELFTTIRTRMPTNAPNSLQATTYLDVLAYILEANGFPAGEAEITADPDRLARILITGA